MRKAQLKMGETIAVLIVFFILIMVGLVIYTNFRSSSIEEKRTEANDMLSIEIATRASLLPEIKCSEYQCIGCSGAIDLIKLDAMTYEYVEGEFNSNDGIVEKNKRVYLPLFGYSYIKVHLLYPDASTFKSDYLDHGLFAVDCDNCDDSPITWNLYNMTRPNMNSYRVSPIFIPVNLYNAYTDECHFGTMEIGVYET